MSISRRAAKRPGKGPGDRSHFVGALRIRQPSTSAGRASRRCGKEALRHEPAGEGRPGKLRHSKRGTGKGARICDRGRSCASSDPRPANGATSMLQPARQQDVSSDGRNPPSARAGIPTKGDSCGRPAARRERSDDGLIEDTVTPPTDVALSRAASRLVLVSSINTRAGRCTQCAHDISRRGAARD